MSFVLSKLRSQRRSRLILLRVQDVVSITLPILILTEIGIYNCAHIDMISDTKETIRVVKCCLNPVGPLCSKAKNCARYSRPCGGSASLNESVGG